MKRLSRSDFVDDRSPAVPPLPARRKRPANSLSVPAAPMMAASGVFRSCDIEVSSAERSRSASAASLALSTSATSWTRSMASAAWSASASSSRRCSGVSSGPCLSSSMPTTPTAPRAGPQRQIEPLGARQRVGAAPGWPVVLPGPLRGGDVGLVQRVLRRIAGLHRDRPVLRQEQHDPHLQHGGDLERCRPENVVERAGAGQLLAEEIEVFGRAGALPRRDRLRCDPRRQIAGDDGDEEEEDEARRRFPGRRS